MATYMLDTTAFSALMDRHPKVVARLEAAEAEHRIIVCTIVRGEILFGLAKMPDGRWKRHLELTAQNVFRRVQCEAAAPSAADHYAQIKAELERQGTPLDENDLWIAATCLDLDARVVTSDTDFKRIRDLPTEDWTL
ncbi:MAG: type II toxin-antitoxin system VapC family toxin [Planctomycetes bacterium]|nr:type II toxin-antitoxin system VapC family toxin [Planctomycetota bacterium]